MSCLRGSVHSYTTIFSIISYNRVGQFFKCKVLLRLFKLLGDYGSLCSNSAVDTAHGCNRCKTRAQRTAPLHHSDWDVCTAYVTSAHVPMFPYQLAAHGDSKNILLLDGVLYAGLDLVRGFFRLEIHQTASVFPIFKDMTTIFVVHLHS